MNRNVLSLALLALVLAPAPARALLDVDALEVHGKDGFRRRKLEGTLTISPKFNWDDPDVPWPFNTFFFRFGRASYTRNGVPGPTYVSEGAAGVKLFSRSSFEGVYAVTPNPSEDAGAYRAREWRVLATAGWEGLVPRIDMDKPAFGRDLETAISFSYGLANIEERIIGGGPPRWTALRRARVGAALAETYRKDTTLRVGLEAMSYDANVADLLAKKDFLVLANTGATAEPEAMAGFASKAWQVNLDQWVGEHALLNGSLRRASYEAGGPARSTTERIGATVFIGLYFSVNGVYEFFHAEGQSGSSYRGGGVALHF